ncbi:MAG: aminoacyl-tRNA hydrolase [Bacteroidetes bacterium]|uniref:Peptidyl-tRNA hydrolase n=1 Tax=Candidatus Cryptobacteroides merdigallinarum TaxID=2840770 RepID=A0A9D9EL89_9BACT|nr:aminoacyl-tRNA hydrolase [Candidatus Cryptobacteroides merdigallinarum]
MNTYLVAGLGNIGAEYSNTRHNMGFMVLDAWAQESDTVFHIERYGSIAETSFKGRRFILLKPSTYMNLSGKAVRYWMNELKLPLGNLIVISDDLNLPFGTLRMRKNGSAGGHNGLSNITELLGSQDYARIRVGIGNNFSRGGQVDFVLGELNEEEMKEMPEICGRVIAGIKAFATAGPDRAMNTVNTKPRKPSAVDTPQEGEAPATEKVQAHPEG